MAVPVTVAVKLTDCPPLSEVVAGVNFTATGISEMVALADLVLSAVLVAVTTTFCALAITAGA